MSIEKKQRKKGTVWIVWYRDDLGRTRNKTKGMGDPTLRKIEGMLQGIFERAIAWGRVKTNPFKYVKKPPARRKIQIRGLSPTEVESLRAALKMLGDRTLVSVVAYGGLRPGEALALIWGDIGAVAIAVDKALSLGEEKETKTGKVRSVPMLRPLAHDLNEWRLACGSPGDNELVFPAPGGGHWQEHTYKNWRRRIFKPAAAAAGLGNIRFYDLRHALASLLFAEGRNPAEIAEHLGNTIETLLSTYVHVIENLRGQPQQKAESVIRKARRKARHINVIQNSAALEPVEEKAP